MCYKWYITLTLIFHIICLVCANDYFPLDSYHPKPTSFIKSDESVLEMSLSSLYSEDEQEQNDTAQPIKSQNCSVAFDQFSVIVINFTRCVMMNARPIHICVECGLKYNESTLAYNNLKKQGDDCTEFFFSSDQVAILDIMYNDMNQLWSKNYCPNCYQHPDLTKRFFKLANSLMDCIHTSNKSELLPRNASCEKCNDLYANLSDTYSAFVRTPVDYGQVCMDVVDTMNVTRKEWEVLNCIPPFDSSIGYPNIIIPLVIGVLPALFYLLAKNVSIIEDVKIVQRKRITKSFVAAEQIKE